MSTFLLPSQVDPERAKTVTPFDEWTKTQPGITIPEPPKDMVYTLDNIDAGLDGWSEAVAQHGRDSHGNAFARVQVDRSAETKREKQATRNKRYKDRRRNNDPTVLKQVSMNDSFKLGEEGSSWKEDGTCDVDNDVSRPPFARLADAANCFYRTRASVFMDLEIRSKWNNVRYVLGLKADFPCLHWPGTGPDAEAYRMIHHARRHASRKLLDDIANGVVGEGCPLIRCPEQASRGLLAIARREVDAVWDEGRAVLFAKIFAALMGYLDQYEILTDDHIAPGFQRALKIAKAGPRLIREAFKLDEEINDGLSINRTAWAKYGGSYCNRTENGTKEASGDVDKNAEVEGEKEDDGGWGAPREMIRQHASEELSLREANNVLAPLYAPISLDSVKLLHYIPFGRRIITAVVPPTKTDGPAFFSTCYKLCTAPAPWSPEERWRELGARALENQAQQAEADAENPPTEDIPFELEHNSVDDPAELDVWVQGKILGLSAGNDGAWLVGMGIRARWAQIGVEGGPAWWILKLKDYVLPSVWRSTEAERKAAKNDPPVPMYDMSKLKPMEVASTAASVAPSVAGDDKGAGSAEAPAIDKEVVDSKDTATEKSVAAEKNITTEKDGAMEISVETSKDAEVPPTRKDIATDKNTALDKHIAGVTANTSADKNTTSEQPAPPAHQPMADDDGDELPNVIAVQGAENDEIDDEESEAADSENDPARQQPSAAKITELETSATGTPAHQTNVVSNATAHDGSK